MALEGRDSRPGAQVRTDPMNRSLAYQPPHYTSKSSRMRRKNVAMTATDPTSRASNIAPASEIIGISYQYASLPPRVRHEGDGRFLSPSLPVLDEETSQVRLPQPLLIEPETPAALAAAQGPEVKGVEEMLHASLHRFDSARLSARYSIGLRITPKPANYLSISAAPRGSAPYVMTTSPRQGLLWSVVIRETSSVTKGYHSPLKTGQMVTEAQTLHPFSPRRKALRPDEFRDLPAVGS